MADVIAEFVAALTFKADLTPLTEAQKKAEETAKKSAEAWAKLGGVIASVGKAALGAAGGLIALVERSASSAAEIEHMAQRYNVSATELQRITFAIGKSGAGPEVLADAFKTLDRQITESRKGVGPAAEAFAALGLSADQLASMGAEERLGILGDRLNKLPDAAQRTKITLDLLGGSADKLVPTLTAGSAGLRAMGDEAERAGIVLGDDALKSAAAFDDELGKVKLQLVGVVRVVGLELIPVVQNMIRNWQEWIGVVGGLGAAFVGLKLGAVASGLTSIGLASAGAAVRMGGLVTIALSLGVAFGTALDNALGLSDAIAGLAPDGTQGRRGVGATNLSPAQRNARDNAQARANAAQEIIDAAGVTAPQSVIDERDNAQRTADFYNTIGGAGAIIDKQNAREADAAPRVAEAYAQIKAEKKREAALKNARAEALRNQKKKKKGGAKSKFSEDIGAGEFEFEEQYGDELRRLAERYGVGSAAVDASIKAGAAAVASGDTPFLARNAALGRLGSSAGVDLTVKRQTDPLLSQIFGDENVPDVALSSIARGAEPQVLISNITNNFTFDIDQVIDGAGDPAMVGDMSGRAIRDFFQGSISQATRTAKVNFAR